MTGQRFKNSIESVRHRYRYSVDLGRPRTLMADDGDGGLGLPQTNQVARSSSSRWHEHQIIIVSLCSNHNHN
jgi:hypothetical protein